MGTYYHTLTTADGLPLPERVICLGVSAYVQPMRHRPGRSLHSCNAWHAIVLDRRGGSCVPRVEHTGTTAVELLSVLRSNLLSGDRTVVVGADLEYTLRLCGIFRLCAEGEVAILDWYSGKTTNHLTLQIEERTVSCVGLENYISMPLSYLSYGVEADEGLRAQTWPYDTLAGDAASSRARCVTMAMGRILGWLFAYARYCWAPTAAGVAWSLYRSRKWGKSVRVHANAEALSLERKSLKGIPVVCNHTGRYGGNVYVLDINSAYGYVMSSKRFPVRLVRTGILSKLQVYDLDSHNYGVIGRVHHYEEGMGHAGTQNTALSGDMPGSDDYHCGSELLDQTCYRSTTAVYESAVYEMDIPFARYINYLYSARRVCKHCGDSVGSSLSKALLCTFYGRWAMKSTRWQDYPEYRGSEDWGYVYSWDKPYRGLNTICVLGGKAKVRVGSGDWQHSFPAISAYVTMYARTYLKELFDVAGREHVLYSDTDSLHVDQVGYDALCGAGLVHGTQLGRLKVVTICADAEYYGPKAYRLGPKLVVSGLAAGAVRDSTGRWINTKRASLLHGVDRGAVDSVVVYQEPFTVGAALAE